MRVLRAVTVLTLALTVGCSSVQRVPLAYIADESPPVVHVANSYGVVTTLGNPQLSGDTVYGDAIGKGRVAVPLGQIEAISTRRFDTARTVLLVAGGVSVVALGAWATFGGSGGPKVQCDYTTRALEANGGAPLCQQP
jgi:hypothetical protein